jgi:hypothetical protein
VTAVTSSPATRTVTPPTGALLSTSTTRPLIVACCAAETPGSPTSSAAVSRVRDTPESFMTFSFANENHYQCGQRTMEPKGCQGERQGAVGEARGAACQRSEGHVCLVSHFISSPDDPCVSGPRVGVTYAIHLVPELCP